MADTEPQGTEPTTTEPVQTEPQTQQEPATTPVQGAASEPATEPSKTEEPVAGVTDSLLGADDDTPEGEPAPQGAPESYEPFEVDGQKFAPEQVEGFVTTARDLGLSQENAQKVFESMVPTARNFLLEDLKTRSAGWAEDTKNDPEIGGDNFKVNCGIASAAYKQYTTPELRQILTSSGLGNHKEMVRLFYRIGKAMQQDTGVTGGASTPAAPHRRYPNSNMVVD